MGDPARGSCSTPWKIRPSGPDWRSADAWGDPNDSQESVQHTASSHGHNDRTGAGARSACADEPFFRGVEPERRGSDTSVVVRSQGEPHGSRWLHPYEKRASASVNDPMPSGFTQYPPNESKHANGTRLADVRSPIHARAVIKRGVPASAPLRREVEHVVDGLQQIYPAFIHVIVEPRVRRVEMPQRACSVAREDAERRILAALRILASEVVLERAVARAQQARSEERRV